MTRSEVLIFGQIGKAVFQQHDRYYLLDVAQQTEAIECRPGDVSLFLDCSSEFSVLTVDEITPDTISNTLDFETRAHRALSMMLSGMNEELSSESRTLSVEAAEELLQEEAIQRFVVKRLLARSMPLIADIHGAIGQSQSTGSVVAESIYEQVLASQSATENLLEAWGGVHHRFFDSPRDAVVGGNALIEAGVFADMVLGANEPSRLGSLVVTYSAKQDLVNVIPRLPHLLNAIRQILVAKHEVATKANPLRDGEIVQAHDELEDYEQGLASTERSIPKLIEEFDKRSRDWKPSRAHEVEEKIKNQISAIGRLIVRRDLDRAQKFLYGLVEFHLQHSEKEHVAKSFCALAKIALDTESIEMAEDLVRYAISLRVRDVVIPSTEAEVLKARGQLEAASRVYEATIRDFPSDSVAPCGYAEVLKDLGELQASRRVYEEAMARFPDDVVVRSGYAEVLKDLGQLDEARKVYEETMARFPNDVVPHNGYAEVLKDLGQLDEARKVYEETMARFPNDVVAHTGYAEVLKDLGQLEAARKVYEETMVRFPNNAFGHNGYAEVLKDLGQLDEARKVYEETRARFPNDVVAHTSYAEVLKDSGQLEAARKVYEETMVRFPNDVVAPNGYAEVLKDLGQLEAARKVYEETMVRLPHDLVARNGCASLMITMGQIDEAESLLSYLLETELSSREHWIGRHVLAMSYLKRGNFDEAIARLEQGWRSVQWKDVKSYFGNALAVARIRRKEFAPALEVLRDNLVHIDVFTKHKQLALVAHAKAEMGCLDEASEALEEIKGTRNPLLLTLKDDLRRRYQLKPVVHEILPNLEIARLQQKIFQEELMLAMAA